MTAPTNQSRAFASYLLLRELPAPAPLERFLACEADEAKRLLVLTRLNAEANQGLELRQRFEELSAREARTQVDGVVAAIESGEADGLAYVVHEYRGAVGLDRVLQAMGEGRVELEASLAATLAESLLRILVRAAEAGLEHLLLLPESVLVEPSGEVSVTDFAQGEIIALSGGQGLAEKDLAPEQRRSLNADGRASIYSAAALIFRLLTRRSQPDEWEPRWTGMMMELSLATVPGEALRPAVRFFSRALAERPSQRFATLRELGQAAKHTIAELGGPRPRQLVADALRELFPPHPRVRLERLLAEREGAPERPSPCPQSESGRSTRVLYNSDTSLRSIEPSLREKMGPHELEILARSRYQVLGELGCGGTGTVYKVLDTTLSETLALKVLRPALTLDSQWLQRFKRELRIARDLDHPNILPAYHLEQLDGLYFYTMRFVDGETLYDRLHQRRLSLGELSQVLVPVGEGLAAAHREGIVHRDIKSSNIMIERQTAHPYLMDFGVAMAPDDLGLTITGQGIGTPLYMAPEQAMGSPITERADIYSFGVVLYEACSGVLPFGGNTSVAVYTRQIKSDYQRLDMRCEVPRALSALVDACLSPEPERRPDTMEEVTEQLRALRRMQAIGR